MNWGNVRTIEDLSDSDCVSNCFMRKSSLQDDAMNWGNVPTIEDLSDSDCVSNWCMRKSSLQILADKMKPKVSAIFGDDKNRIKCKNRYTINSESGLIHLAVQVLPTSLSSSRHGKDLWNMKIPFICHYTILF